MQWNAMQWNGRRRASCLAHHITQITSGSMLRVDLSDIHIYEHEQFCKRSSIFSSVLLCLQQLCAVLHVCAICLSECFTLPSTLLQYVVHPQNQQTIYLITFYSFFDRECTVLPTEVAAHSTLKE